MFSMKGKVTIVTGGSGGIGFAAAEAIAEAGGDIALVYNSAKGMEERAEELAKKYSVKVKAYKCAISDYEAVAKLVQDVKADFGRVDCFIANGGSGRINELSVDEWRKIQAVNFDAVFYAAKAVGPVFEAQGSGSFIATTSISAHIVNVPLDQLPVHAVRLQRLEGRCPSLLQVGRPRLAHVRARQHHLARLLRDPHGRRPRGSLDCPPSCRPRPPGPRQGAQGCLPLPC
ncbi:SPOSA6832_03563, partial [Sporobolomyces salmonicolor]